MSSPPPPREGEGGAVMRVTGSDDAGYCVKSRAFSHFDSLSLHLGALMKIYSVKNSMYSRHE